MSVPAHTHGCGGRAVSDHPPVPELLSPEKAAELDRRDPLASWRDAFHFPINADLSPKLYLCGNSLGLQPKSLRDHIEAELQAWQDRAVDGHFEGENPWYSYHARFSEMVARLVGAQPDEVVVMGSLTANLHTLMVSFYRPTKERFKIVVEGGAFPSDRFAVQSQARAHGFDPAQAVVELQPRPGEVCLRTEDIEAWLAKEGDSVALLLMSGVNFYSGQVFDMERITRAGKKCGARVGWDLAHAAGNVPLKLHDWGVDFAAWCSYKYLNSGPGGVAGAFVHSDHGESPELVRFAGWWGHDPETRFLDDTTFSPQKGAAGWQVSNAPVLAMAAHMASLEIFDQVGLPALREKSLKLTGYLRELLESFAADRFEIITPREEAAHGAQLSIRFPKAEAARGIFDQLEARGIVGDFRAPDVIRASPAPLYNSFADAQAFALALFELVEARWPRG
jgi:kynureninase